MTYSKGYCASVVRGLVQRLGDEVGLDAEDDAHVVLVLAREPLDERDVVVQFVQPHRPIVLEVVARLPSSEERQMIGEPHLRHPQLDRALHVLARVAHRMTAETGVDVVVGDHQWDGGRRSARPPCGQAYTRRRAPGRRRANTSTSTTPATKPPRWAKKATPASPDRERLRATHSLQHEPDDEQDPGRHLEHRPDHDERDHREDALSREQHQVAAEHAGDRAAGADERHVAGRSDEHLRGRRRHPADEVEEDEPRPRHRVLDVVAEDPQVPHVEDQVQPAAVHEHRREQRGPPREPGERRHVDVVGELERPRPEQVVPAFGRDPPPREEELNAEDDHVGGDERHRHGREAARRIVVMQRDH